MNGKHFPKWSIWFDEKGNKYSNEKNARARIQFKCSECGENFLQESHLHEHKNNHSKLSPYECDICEQRFSETSGFLEHRMKLHSQQLKSVKNIGDIVLSKLEELNSAYEENLDPNVKIESVKNESFDIDENGLDNNSAIRKELLRELDITDSSIKTEVSEQVDYCNLATYDHTLNLDNSNVKEEKTESKEVLEFKQDVCIGSMDKFEPEYMEYDRKMTFAEVEQCMETSIQMRIKNELFTEESPLHEKKNGEESKLEAIECNDDIDDFKVFVGDLHEQVKKEDIQDHFQTFGPVVDIDIRKDKFTGKSIGFGFVIFKSLDGLEKALAVKNHSIKSKQISVARNEIPIKTIKRTNYAESSTETTEYIDDLEECKLFVGGLPQQAKKEDIHAYFHTFGPVRGIDIKTDQFTGISRGFGFVVFVSAFGLERALAVNNHSIKSKQISVTKARCKPGKIYVGKLVLELSNEDIKSHFGKFGKIELVEQPLDKKSKERKPFCFITYKNEANAKRLIKAGTTIINGYELTVKKTEMPFNPALDNNPDFVPRPMIGPFHRPFGPMPLFGPRAMFGPMAFFRPRVPGFRLRPPFGPSAHFRPRMFFRPRPY